MPLAFFMQIWYHFSACEKRGMYLDQRKAAGVSVEELTYRVFSRLKRKETDADDGRAQAALYKNSDLVR